MVNTGTSIWSDDLVAKLKELWASELSASQIAAKLGNITRSAVIGKANRLKLERRSTNNQDFRNRAKKSKPKEKRPGDGLRALHIKHRLERSRSQPKLKPEPYVAAEAVDIAPRMIPLLVLTSRTCKYGIGDVGEPGFGFCGHETAPGKPYCPAHCALTYRPPEKRERRPIYRESSTPRFGGRAA